MKIKTVVLGITALLLATSSAFAAKTFVYCSEGSPTAFNPQVFTDGASSNASNPIYNKMVDFKLGTTQVQPALAESWAISKDGLKYKFKLRKGVKFQTTAYFKPTRELNADDVLFTFNRQRLKDHPYHKVSGGTYEFFDSMGMGQIIKDIRKIDDYTVEFELSQPEAPFLANLAMDFASILSKEYGDQLLKAGKPEKIDFEPVGTGPFIFVKYQKDQMIRYTANPDYFGGRPRLDQLVFSITPDSSVRLQKLRRGECHFVNEPSPADLDAIKADKNLKVASLEGLNVAYVSMNVTKPPFDKKEVRLEVNYALNKKSYLGPIYMGNAVVAKNPIPPTIWGYNDDVKDYEYNPEKAKELLKKAGFPNGFETELWTLPVSRPYNPNGKKLGELMQADLAKVGIKVKLVTYDWPTYLAKARDGVSRFAQYGWTGDNGDPDNFMNVLLGCSGVAGGSNNARWCFKEYDDLVNKAKRDSDPKKRAVFYKEAQLVVKREAPIVTIAHSKTFRAMAKNVEGYVMDPLGQDYFHQVDLK